LRKHALVGVWEKRSSVRVLFEGGEEKEEEEEEEEEEEREISRKGGGSIH
jgi:hypothetical protein